MGREVKAQMDWLKKHKFVMVAIFILILMLLGLEKWGGWRKNLMPEACEMPCWRDIKVGETTDEQFLQMAEAHPEQFSDLFLSESSDSSVYYRWIDNEAKQFLSAFVDADHIVEAIRISTANQVQLGDAIAVFGSPDTYSVSLLGGGGAGSLNVNLFYEDLGIVMDQFFLPYVPTEEELATCSINISEEFPLDDIDLIEPNPGKQMAEATGLPIFDEPRNWEGVGDVALTTCDYVEKR